MKTKYVLQWKNKWSGEIGYVGKISRDHFENTKNKANARKFVSVKAAETGVNTLKEIGEADANDFYVVEM